MLPSQSSASRRRRKQRKTIETLTRYDERSSRNAELGDASKSAPAPQVQQLTAAVWNAGLPDDVNNRGKWAKKSYTEVQTEMSYNLRKLKEAGASIVMINELSPHHQENALPVPEGWCAVQPRVGIWKNAQSVDALQPRCESPTTQRLVTLFDTEVLQLIQASCFKLFPDATSDKKVWREAVAAMFQQKSTKAFVYAVNSLRLA